MAVTIYYECSHSHGAEPGRQPTLRCVQRGGLPLAQRCRHALARAQDVVLRQGLYSVGSVGQAPTAQGTGAGGLTRYSSFIVRHDTEHRAQRRCEDFGVRF